MEDGAPFKIMNKKIFWCKSCINMSTRPRITFDDNGICNACQWREEKKKLDWAKRITELKTIIKKKIIIKFTTA